MSADGRMKALLQFGYDPGTASLILEAVDAADAAADIRRLTAGDVTDLVNTATRATLDGVADAFDEKGLTASAAILRTISAGVSQ